MQPTPSVPNAHSLHRPLPEEEAEREPGEVWSELPAQGPALLLLMPCDESHRCLAMTHLTNSR